MKIFLLDDEEAPLYFLRRELEVVCPGAEIRCFTFWKTFMDAFREELPDVVFLDIEMPECEGISLAKELSKIKNNVNIIFQTAYPQYVLEAFKTVASGYILKPIKQSDVRSVMDNLRYPLVK